MNAILEQLNSMGQTFVEFAGPMLVQSSVLIVILLLVDLALRKRVRAVFRYCIWMLVLAKLVLPSSLSSPLSLGYLFGDSLVNVTVSGTRTTAETGQMSQPLEMPGEGEARSVEAISMAPIAAPTTGGIEPAVVEAAGAPVASMMQVTWQGAVFLVWLAVVGAMVLLLLQRALFVRGLVAQARNANSLMNDAFKYCCTQMGMKREVGLKVSANATSPAVCGLFRPVVLVPQNLGPSLGSSGLRTVLLHELAHIKRRDLWVNLVQTVLQIIYFYNPLLWLANAIIRRVREQAVDETVQVAMGERAQQYPETLVNVAKLAFKRPALSLRLIGVVESESALKGRIKRMLNRPIPKSAKLGILGLIAVVIIGAVLLPMAKAEKKQAIVGQMRAFLPNCNVWLADINGQDLHVLDLAGERIIKHEQVESDYELDSRDEGDILYYYDRAKNCYKVTFLRGAGLNGEAASDEYSTLTTTELEMPFDEIVTTREGIKYKVKFLSADEHGCTIEYRPQKGKAEGFKAILPNGVTVELVGICEYPSEGKQWWRPDGTVLPEDIHVKKGGTVVARGKAFAFAVKVKGPEDMTFTWGEIEGSRGTADLRVVDSEGQTISDMEALKVHISENVPETSVRLGVATSPWESKVEHDGSGSIMSTGTGEWGIVFSGAYATDQGVKINVSDDLLKLNHRIIAIDLDGKAHIARSSWGSAGKIRQTAANFEGLSLEQIKEFQFQTRPYEWVEFKNVSLRPGVKTDVEIEVEGASWKELEKIVEQAVMTISTCAESDPRVGKSLESLKGLDENAVVNEVAKFLDSGKNTVRRSAIFILWKGNFKSIEPAVSHLQKLCSHEESFTRGMAAIALGAAKIESSFDTLCEMTLEDSSSYARRCAAYSLGLMGRVDAKPVLEKALKDSDFNVRNNAEAALTMLSQATEQSSNAENSTVEAEETSKASIGAIDVAIEDFKIRAYDAGGLYVVTVAIQNNSNVTAPAFRLNFYRGEPADNLNLHGKPQTGSHGAGPIKPGDVWNEGSMPFALKEGINEIAVVLDPDNKIAEPDETNNRASMKIVVKDGQVIEKSVSYSAQKSKGRARIKTDVEVEVESFVGSDSSDTTTVQRLIDSARPGGTVIVPKGVYTEPIEITKSLTLKGQSRADCVFEVTENKPAIFVDTKGKGRVTIEEVTIKWQLATSDKDIEYPFALGVKDTKAEVKNCSFQPLGNFKRSPVAIRAIGFSELTISNCRFEGFDYVVCYNEGTKGTMQDSLIMNCKSQGIILYRGATVNVIKNVITGSGKHAVRSTGGALHMKDNLIIENANRGVYLGNKSAHGTITNNIIMGNRIVGISGFAQSDVKICNNLILNSGQVGIGAQPTCRLLVKDNIIMGNPQGIVVFQKDKSERAMIVIGKNTFWNNDNDTENCKKAPQSISQKAFFVDPNNVDLSLQKAFFVDPDNGDFSLRPGPAKERKQGLTNPQIFKTLWKRWQRRTDKNEPFSRAVTPEKAAGDFGHKAAVEAAYGWLKLVDDGDYGESWEQAAGYFKKAVGKEQFQKSVEPVRSPLGRVISRKVKSKRYTKQVPGGPDGEYVIIQFDTSFENKRKAIETVTPMLDKDGTWRVSGYYIK